MRLYPIYEEITFTDKVKPIYDYNIDTEKDEKIGEKHVIEWKYKEPNGGSAYGEIENEIASVTYMSSSDIMKSQEEQEQNKRKGFFKRILLEMVKKGAKKLRINLQSKDTRAAIARLMELRILHSPEAYVGISVDEHPSLLSIDANKLKQNLAYENTDK